MAGQLQLQSKLKHNSSLPLHPPESAESTPSSGQASTSVPPSTSASVSASANSANNPSASNSSSNAPANSTSSSAPTFEFTRRKRWADILINEVPENIILVLSPTGVIWFSGVAMVELLGWTIEEVLDKDFLCFVNDSDQTIFRNCFIESLATGELFTYVRLRCKKDMIVNPDNSRTFKELLFEIKGYPHYVADDPRCKCFFAMARPYPTRSAAFLNTFLELKIENERLKLQQEHVHRSIASIPSSLLTPSLALPALSAVGFPGFPQTFFNATQDGSLSGSVSIGIGVGGDAKTGVGVGGGGGVGVVGSSGAAAGPGAGTVTYGILAATNAFGFTGTMGYEDESEVTSIVAGSGSGSGSGTGSGQKRKTSRNFPEERYVCVSCGRTDSPEWRKGPAGPKTLCNACGLRYAKKARKMPIEDRDLAGATSTASNPSSSNGNGGNSGGSGPGVQNGNSKNQGLYGSTSRNGSGVSIAGVGTGVGGYGLPASSAYAGFQQS